MVLIVKLRYWLITFAFCCFFYVVSLWQLEMVQNAMLFGWDYNIFFTWIVIENGWIARDLYMFSLTICGLMLFVCGLAIGKEIWQFV